VANSGKSSSGEAAGEATSVLNQLGVTPLIAAGGPNTLHSGTRPRPEAIRAMEEMSETFVRMDELLIAAGEEIASMIGVPAATVTSGASGGLVLQSAAALSKGDPDVIAQLPITDGLANELIIQRGHRFAYDHLYLVPGARYVEVGTETGSSAKDISDAIGPNTAAIIHLIPSSRDAATVSLEESVEIAHSNGLPLLLDAASTLPPRANLTKFVEAGADLVSFSGGKGVRGPQNTGMLLGDPKWVEYARLNNAPYATVARSQKVSKEAVAGLVAGLRAFLAVDEEQETAQYRRDMQLIVDQVVEIPGVIASVEHGDDYYIPHAVIEFGEAWKDPSSMEVGQALLAGDPRIYLRHGYEWFNGIAVDPLNIQPGELEIVADRVRSILISAASGEPIQKNG
jgi:D-glucosaminate-6-phosphate ammonia-lyase